MSSLGGTTIQDNTLLMLTLPHTPAPSHAYTFTQTQKHTYTHTYSRQWLVIMYKLLEKQWQLEKLDTA